MHEYIHSWAQLCAFIDSFNCHQTNDSFLFELFILCELFIGYRPKYPIVLVPGFMCSGMVIEESTVRPDWVGNRAWVSSLRLVYASFS